jgi:hypothetical protein
VRGEPVGVAEIPSPDELCPSLDFEETEYWYVCGARSLGARQGWKLYVPLTILNARAATQQLVPLVAACGLPFKYVKTIKALRKLNAGSYGYPQIGKCFVIYLPVVDESFVLALREALAPYRDQCPAVPCARPFGDGIPLFYRYGAFAGMSVELDDHSINDDRATLADAVPAGVQDVLLPYTTPPAGNPAVAAFLRDYPIFRALVQQGKGGVFHAMKLSSPTFQEVALKVGYHRGQVQVDGSDGCSFLRHELGFYRLLADRGIEGLAPSLVDALDVPGKVILALEYIQGTTLLAEKLSGRLTTGQLERAWDILEQFHAGGLFIGDAKLANILVAEDGDTRAVDFEAAGCFGGDRVPIRTFFIDPDPGDPRVADKAHFLASILYPYEAGRYSWQDRHVGLADLLGREAHDEASAWALNRLRALL